MNHNRLIIGVDPGLACGFAVLDGELFGSNDMTVLEAADEIDRLLRKGRPAILSVERFTFQASSSKKTRQYDALEFIGIAKYLGHKYGVPVLIPGASEAQRIGSRETLVALGWWKKGYDHANKAAAQVVYAYAQTHPREFAERLPPGMI